MPFLVHAVAWFTTRPIVDFYLMAATKVVCFLAAKRLAFRDAGVSFSKGMRPTERRVVDLEYFPRIASQLAQFDIYMSAILIIALIHSHSFHPFAVAFLLLAFVIEVHALATWWGKWVFKDYLRTNQGWKHHVTPSMVDLGIAWIWIAVQMIVFTWLVIF